MKVKTDHFLFRIFEIESKHICNSRCPPEFAILFREFGGNVSIRDGSGQLATDISTPGNEDDNLRTTVQLLRLFQGEFRTRARDTTLPIVSFFLRNTIFRLSKKAKKELASVQKSMRNEMPVCSTNYDAAVSSVASNLCQINSLTFSSLQTRREK